MVGGAATGLGYAAAQEAPDYLQGRRDVADWQMRLKNQKTRRDDPGVAGPDLASLGGGPLPQTFNPFQVQ